MTAQVAVLANNGTVAGGEVMQLLIADALRVLGLDVIVVGPSEPSGLVERAREGGHSVEAVPATGRRDYVVALRRWARASDADLLWCNGLVPGLATAGLRRRLLHLHRLPDSPAQRVSLRLARAGARLTVVPSQMMADALPGTRVLANWSADLPERTPPAPAERLRVGFLGRLTADKGVHLLAEAIALLEAGDPGSVSLVLAGEARFGTAADERLLGPALARVEHLTTRLGWVAPEDFFAAVDAAAFPSVWPEPFGLTVAEAMSARVPFVVSDAGALPEVAGRDHPWTCRAGDARSLADAIAALARSSPHAHSETVATARARWEERFSPTAGRARVADLVTDLGLLPHGGGA